MQDREAHCVVGGGRGPWLTFTLQPTPYTLHHTPYTLHAQPLTLLPKPYQGSRQRTLAYRTARSPVAESPGRVEGVGLRVGGVGFRP